MDALGPARHKLRPDNSLRLPQPAVRGGKGTGIS